MLFARRWDKDDDANHFDTFAFKHQQPNSQQPHQSHAPKKKDEKPGSARLVKASSTPKSKPAATPKPKATSAPSPQKSKAGGEMGTSMTTSKESAGANTDPKPKSDAETSTGPNKKSTSGTNTDPKPARSSAGTNTTKPGKLDASVGTVPVQARPRQPRTNLVPPDKNRDLEKEHELFYHWVTNGRVDDMNRCANILFSD